MKRILYAALFLLFVTVASNVYASEVIYEKCFEEDLSFANTSYSDAPATWNGQAWAKYNSPKFKVTDGEFVYNTEAVAGTAYPYNGTRVSYPRVNFPKESVFPVTSGQMNETSYTFEADIRFEKNFARYDFLVRMGADNWVSGITSDVSLFTISAKGYLTFGNYQQKLELGTNYKISVVVDIVNNRRYKSLYVEGVCVSENQTMSVAGTDATESQLKYLAYPAIRMYPHTSDSAHSSKKWLDLICSMDNIKIYKGNPYSANEPVYVKSKYDVGLIPADSGVYCSEYFTLSRKTEGVRWKLSEKESGISIDKNTGELIFTNDVKTEDVTVLATLNGDIIDSKTFKFIRCGYFGDSSINRFENAVVKNIDGENILSHKSESDNSIVFNIDDGIFDGRMVINAEVKAKDSTSDAGIEAIICENNSTICKADTGIHDSWVRVKMVIDTQKKTSTVLLDDKPISEVEAKLSAFENGKQIQLVFLACDIKSLSVYRAPQNIAPMAFNVNIKSLEMGNAVACTYDYFSESGLEESCTLTEWFVLTPTASEYASLGSTYTPTAKDKDKLFKVSVTPASDTLKGTSYMSEPKEVQNIYFSSANYQNNIASAEVVVTNDSDETLNAYIIAAEYCDNRLVSSDIERLSAKIGETVSAGIKLEGSGGLVKIMLIDLKTLVPLLSEALCLSQDK